MEFSLSLSNGPSTDSDSSDPMESFGSVKSGDEKRIVKTKWTKCLVYYI